MTPTTDIVKYSESVYLVSCRAGGPRHVVAAGDFDRTFNPNRAVCPARPIGPHQGPMYLADALEREGVCRHCRKALERAGGEVVA